MAEQHTKDAGGRPRDEQIDAALIRATLEVLDSDGYVGLSLETVARKAGTTRPALYRRWSGRAELVLAAIDCRLHHPSPPNTGCTLCDIGESFNVFLASYRTIRPETLSGLYADCASDPDLHARYLETIIEPARRAVGATLDHAIANGDLRPDVNRDLLLDFVGSLVHYRAVFGPAHLSQDEADHAIELLMRGAALDYAALLAHSAEIEVEQCDAPPNHHPHASTTLNDGHQ